MRTKLIRENGKAGGQRSRTNVGVHEEIEHLLLVAILLLCRVPTHGLLIVAYDVPNDLNQGVWALRYIRTFRGRIRGKLASRG